jgi:hypothetical protein
MTRLKPQYLNAMLCALAAEGGGLQLPYAASATTP